MAKILTSPIFTLNRNKIPNLDPPAGLFVNHLRSLFECDFVSLDSRLDLRKYTMDKSFGSAEEVDNVRILQSCNGLFSCAGWAWHSFGSYSDDLVLILMEIPQILHLEGKFFESRGCLLLVSRDDIGSREVTIYKMMNGYSV
ncbi:hypothetical protein Tco_1523740 [Tanacetum coccineum]